MAALAPGGHYWATINTAWLGGQISNKFGSVLAIQPSLIERIPLSIGERFSSHLQISYSHEGRDSGTALETAGDIARALRLLLRAAMDQHRVTAELYTGLWTDVGTPQRLQDLNASPNDAT